MASSITIRVATFTSTYTVANLSDAQVADILRWMMADKSGPEPEGLTQAQLNQWRLDQALAEVVRYITQEARRNRLAERKAASDALIDTEVEAEISL